jgi:hypothetical protein
MATNNQGANTSNAKQSTPEKIKRESSLNRQKYSIDNLQYPLDLFSGEGSKTQAGSNNSFFNQIYKNYVVFYINVSSQSRVFTDGKIQIVGDVDKSDQNTVQGKQASLGKAAATSAVGGAAVGFTVGLADGARQEVGNAGRPNADGSKPTKAEAVTTFVKGTLGNAAAGAIKGGGATGLAVEGQGLLMEQAFGGLKTTQSTKRLKTAIALHVPNEVSVGYRATYGEEELGAIFGAGAEAATNGAGALDSAGMGMQGAVVKGLEMNPARAALSALYKAAPNPRKEQLFKSMEFRRFSFNYQFAPRSKKEADNIKRIINTFKFYMHPEYQNNVNKMLYLFPSEFDIVYYFGDKEHPHLNKISTCVLTDLQVNYSPNGQFATFDDGMPAQINLQMSFLELETLSKERFLGESPDGQPKFSSQNFEDPNLAAF